MIEVVDRLLPSSVCMIKGEHLDYDELVRWAIKISDHQLQDKRFK